MLPEPKPDKMEESPLPIAGESLADALEKAYDNIKSSDLEKRRIGHEAIGVIIRDLRMGREQSGEFADMLEVLSEAVVSPEEQKQIDYDIKALEIFEQLRVGVHDGLFVVDKMGGISMANRAMEEITGYEPEEIVGLPYGSLIHPDDYDDLVKKLSESETDDHVPQEYRIRNKQGEIRWVRVSTYQIDRHTSEIPQEIAGLMTDITETVELREKLERMSMQDPLTELPNRRYLDMELDRLKIGRHYPISFIYIDVDDFKKINDTRGHSAGDDVLKDVALLLRCATRGEDFVARVGGDEFLIPLPSTDEKGAKDFIERIQSVLDSYNVHGDKLNISLSMGTITADDVEEFDSALKRADGAMYEAKRAKKQEEARAQLRTVLEE